MAFKPLTLGPEGPLAGQLPESIALDEVVYILSGTSPDLDPDVGTIQVWGLTGVSNPVDTLTEGQSMTLMISAGETYSVNWPTMTWIGTSPPGLSMYGHSVVVLWKANNVLYGKYIGDTEEAGGDPPPL